MFWIAFIGVYMLLLAVSGAIVENYPRIKRRAARLLYIALSGLQKMFVHSIQPIHENCNLKTIR